MGLRFIFIFFFILILNACSYNSNTETLNFEKAQNIILQSESLNYDKALNYFNSHSEDSNSQYYLGVMYFNGLGANVDYEKAFYWYNKSASQGNYYSSLNLGKMYDAGIYVKQDYSKAFNLYLKAAESGNDEAQYNLGVMYDLGKGVDKNIDKALELYQLSAKKNNPEALFNLGVYYTSDKIDYEKAFNLFLKASSLGHIKAKTNLATMYFLGLGVNKNYKEGRKLINDAANNGDSLAKLNIGLYYFEGKFGFEKNYELSRKWLEESCSMKEEKACMSLKKLF
ncbi:MULTISPECIES: tetratricopeptide repeat protein [unclassified Acinetobacter]|uniref:tetratricopeptide repeat protein n=1 Tax=unclassified Acinetobacter TaxID=196816 RepID=UPI0015D1D1C4|nr:MULTISPECIES: tetratricopeptide repeat protein [unclassified Acinetobacter]QOW51457.1 sel1 repeat family protein [Acinetobacter sp. YH12138]